MAWNFVAPRSPTRRTKVRHRRSAVVRLVPRHFSLADGLFFCEMKAMELCCSAQPNSTNESSPSSVCCGAPCTAHFLFAIVGFKKRRVTCRMLSSPSSICCAAPCTAPFFLPNALGMLESAFDKRQARLMSAPCEGRGTACGGGVVVIPQSNRLSSHRTEYTAKKRTLASLPQSRSPAMIASGEFRVMIAFGKL